MVKEVVQIRFRIVTHPCWSPTKLIKQLRKTISKIVRQPQSPVLVYCSSYWPLPLAQAIQTHFLNQFGFLSLNYKQKRHPSAMLRQEVEGLWKSLEHSDAYFLVQQQALEDFSAKQDKANKLAKLIASMVDT